MWMFLCRGSLHYVRNSVMLDGIIRMNEENRDGRNVIRV